MKRLASALAVSLTVSAACTSATSSPPPVHTATTGVAPSTSPSAPGSPSVSPPSPTEPAPVPGVRNGVLAFFTSPAGSGGLEIVETKPDRTGRRQITHIQDLSAAGLSWSPDGKHLAFARGLGTGQGAIDVVNADGTGLHQITHVNQVYNEPAWSPDGRLIVFASGSGTVEVMHVDGTHIHPVFHKPSDCGAEGLSWAPDTAHLVFELSCASPGPGTTSIQVIGADGSARRTLLGPAKAIPEIGPVDFKTVELSAPAWSPDGSRIAFVETEERFSGRGLLSQICVMNADGSGISCLAPSGARGDSSPVWSPDDTRIAFLGVSVPGGAQIFTVDADGSHVRQVTHEKGGVSYLAWQPLHEVTG